MATKTITIDIEAYARLKRVQKGKESFSQTIKRVVRPPLDIDAWLERMRKARLSPEATAAIERQVGGRRSRGGGSRSRRNSERA